MAAAAGEWKADQTLREDLAKYVEANLKRTDILDFMKRDYSQYLWSLRTLTRRLAFFKITYIDYGVNTDNLREIIRNELDGPGACLGYRALHKKVREVHGLKVPRTLVYNMMFDVDPTGLENRRNVGKPKWHRKPRPFTSKVCTV